MATERGLNRRLGRGLLLQAAYISMAVVVGIFVAARLMEDVLIKQALHGEAAYYWELESRTPGRPLPDTKNMTGYRPDHAGGVPDYVAALDPGFHRQDSPREILTYVSEHDGKRLFLVFEMEQVTQLVTLFGLIPLAIALTVIYVSLYSAYRLSRRAVSPVISLAARVQALDPKQRRTELFPPQELVHADDEIRILAEALQGLIDRVSEFAEREMQFTRDASHELRTPLTVIKMAVDRAQRGCDLDEGQRDALQRIRKSADDMERLTSAFLLLARETKDSLEHEWCCVNEIVSSEMERLKLIHHDRPIEAREVSENPLFVLAPEKVVESVVGNLLRNAFTYTDEGMVSTAISGDSVTIEDTGPGMDAEEAQKAFEPYVRSSRQRGGFGVGLTIVKRLSDRFGWTVRIESAPGKGTRVRVTFPGSASQLPPPG